MSEQGTLNLGNDPKQRDWGAASAAVADAYFPHRLEPAAGTDASGVVLNVIRLGPVTLAHIGWGAQVSVRSDHPDAYAVNITLSGRISSEVGRQEVRTGQGDATVCPPDVSTYIRHWSSQGEILGVRIDRDRLRQEVERITGVPSAALPTSLDLRSGAALGWSQLVRSIWEQRLTASELLRNAAVAERMGETILAGLIAVAGPDSSDREVGNRPGIVKRVTDALQENPAHHWTVQEMAHLSGVSVRRLQEVFSEFLGASPIAYLRELRLDRVHADLLYGDPGQCVTDVAFRWGFVHTGRFAAAYRRRYGASPSETLRR